MGIEDQAAALTGMSVMENAKVVEVLVADTLEVYEQTVNCDSDAGGAFTLTLPPVSVAKGKFYSIKLITAGYTLTVADQDDSYDFNEGGGDFVFTAATDFVLLFSDGHKWYAIDEQTT